MIGMTGPYCNTLWPVCYIECLGKLTLDCCTRFYKIEPCFPFAPVGFVAFLHVFEWNINVKTFSEGYLISSRWPGYLRLGRNVIGPWGMQGKTSFKWLPQCFTHQDAGKQLSNFRFQGTNKKSNVFSEQGWVAWALPQHRHLISLTEQKGSDTLRESSVKLTAFQERWTKAVIIPLPRSCSLLKSMHTPERENGQSLFIKPKSTNLGVTCSPVSTSVFYTEVC